MNRRPVILDVAVGPLYWLIIAVSIWVLLRGHNEPGGGFIGGLVALSATILWAAAHGSHRASRRLPLGSPYRLAAVGVGLSALSGVPGAWIGLPYLTHLWGAIPLGVTDLKVSTVMLFDLGVYLCVWGALAGYATSLMSLGEGEEGESA